MKGLYNLMLAGLLMVTVSACGKQAGTKISMDKAAEQMEHNLAGGEEQQTQEGDNTGYKKVAIYGMGQLGETLFHELVYSGVEVVFGIDRNKDHLDCDIDIYSLEEKLPHADVIIVTAVTYYSEVVWFLSRKVECPIESLENIIVELGREEGIAV